MVAAGARLCGVPLGIEVLLDAHENFPDLAHAKLNSWGEVVQYSAPTALVARPTPIALVNNDEVGKVGRVVPEAG